MQSVAGFPPRTSPHFTPSPLAPGRCYEAVRGTSALCESLKPHELEGLGPLFIFSVWVAARNMIGLWTTGWEEQLPAIPAELATLRNVLRKMSQHWLCAQHYSDMIDLVVDSSDRVNEESVLAVFNDVSKTAYGLHNVLGPRIKRNLNLQVAQIWDWVNISSLEQGGFLSQNVGSVSQGSQDVCRST